MQNEFQQNLLDWYRASHRELIFRKNREPYAIWVSEIMAQQTRIEAMLKKYEQFMEKFPTLSDLAKAEEDELMQVWQGLGYYSRARNLQKAARVCVEQYEGQLPRSKKELAALPGIGDYTAGAIASIAFNERVSAVDGNVIRVFSRLYYLKENTGDARVKKKITALVEESLPEAVDMPDYNQALMELGALVCIPRSPRCSICPVQAQCLGYGKEDIGELPVKNAPRKRRVEKRPVRIWTAWKDGILYVHLRRRPEKGLLAGLYEFDETEPEVILAKESLPAWKHVFSHVEWEMDGELIETQWQPDFVEWQALSVQYAIPSAFLPFYQAAAERLKDRVK